MALPNILQDLEMEAIDMDVEINCSGFYKEIRFVGITKLMGVPDGKEVKGIKEAVIIK